MHTYVTQHMTHIKTILAFAFALLTAVRVQAEVPPGYYDAADGLNKESLKAALHIIIANATTLNYGSGASSTWSGFYQTDRLPDGRVVDRYSRERHYFAASDNAHKAYAPSGLNIEHSIAKSWWGGGRNQAFYDLHHLMPSEEKINAAKSNFPIGVVTHDTSGNGYTKVGTGKGPNGETIQMWEPADEWKGDFARVYFYMATCYSHLNWQGAQAQRQMDSDWQTLQKWTYELLLQWSRQDPVSAEEEARNEAVYRIQGNRNPFIDHPELCEYIWGKHTAEAWSATSKTAKKGKEKTR